MPTKTAKKVSKKKSKKSSTGPRELITPNGKGSSRYQRRDEDGKFGDADLVSRSQAADKAKHSSKTPPENQGDKGDYPKRKK